MFSISSRISIINDFVQKISTRTNQLLFNQEKRTFHYALQLFKNRISEETYFRELEKDPVRAYKKFQQKPTCAVESKPLLLKTIDDLENRLTPNSVLVLPQFHFFRKELSDLLVQGKQLLSMDLPIKEFNSFMIHYVETMDKLLRSTDPNLKGTFHRDFARGCMKTVLDTHDGTRLFFTAQAVNDLYFWHIRPSAIYLNWVTDLPPFSYDATNYQKGPLVPTQAIQKSIDGLLLDTEEILKHDFGHTFFMKRQDTWLFKTSGITRTELVAQWTENKNNIFREWQQLNEKDPIFGKAIRFLISEIIHDRGYQFHLPILKQQFSSSKWREIIRSKNRNGYFGKNGPTQEVEEKLDEGRLWVVNLIERMMIEENLKKIESLKAKSNSVTVKNWLSLENYVGIPQKIEVKGIQDFRVHFDVSNVGNKSTSLYEIALVMAPKSHFPILSQEKIDRIERWIWQKKHAKPNVTLELNQDGEILVSGKMDDTLETCPSDEKLSPVELYKLERLLNVMANKMPVPFTVTHFPELFTGKVIDVDPCKNTLTLGCESDLQHTFSLSEVSLQPRENIQPKYINLNPLDRFIDENLLRESYLHYDQSVNVTARPYVIIDNKYELGMVNSKNHQIAKAISSILTRSLDDAKYTKGGYLPPPVVERVQRELISTHGVMNVWGKTGHRFVLSRPAANGKREIISTILVSESRDGMFFFTSMFNNLKLSKLKDDIDFEISADGNPDHKWFDKFRFPDVELYKPQGYHHIANFVVEKEDDIRGKGIARLMIQEIVKNYSRDYIQATNGKVIHSQRLLCGKGFWQIGDPPWLERMGHLGFFPRLGCETFHYNVDWDPLIPTYDNNGKIIEHVPYNKSFGLPDMYIQLLEGKDSPYQHIYEEALNSPSSVHLIHRIPAVIELAKSGKAKLQFFQLLFPFLS